MFVPGLELGFEFLEQAAICSVFRFFETEPYVSQASANLAIAM